MGAWGVKLFQSDHDYNIINMLNHLCGLPEMERKAGRKRATQAGTDARRQEEHFEAMTDKTNNATTSLSFLAFPQVANGKGQVYYSVYSGLCSHPNVVRKHLDGGALSKAISGVRGTISRSSKKEVEYADGPGYDLVVLVACAMSLGAELSTAEMNAVRKLYARVGLMPAAIVQMEEACDPKTGYKNGTPWDFGSLGLRDSTSTHRAQEDLLCPGTPMINTYGPLPLNDGEKRALGPQYLRLITKHAVSAKDLVTGFANLGLSHDVPKKVKQFDEAACAGCGAEAGNDNGPFTVCGKCKARRYCSKECLKAHWTMGHRKECKAAVVGDGETEVQG